jgi:hypothetical protein
VRPAAPGAASRSAEHPTPSLADVQEEAALYLSDDLGNCIVQH